MSQQNTKTKISMTLTHKQIEMLGLSPESSEQEIIAKLHCIISALDSEFIKNAEYNKQTQKIDLTCADNITRQIQPYTAEIIGKAADVYYTGCDVDFYIDCEIKQKQLNPTILNNDILISAIKSDYMELREKFSQGCDTAASWSECLDMAIDKHSAEIEKYKVK